MKSLLRGETGLWSARLERAYRVACDTLLAERSTEGFWIGELASSALATATAVSAISLVPGRTAALQSLIDDGVRWMAGHQNADGGWGDTTLSLSNISTTMLCRAAISLAGAADSHVGTVQKATHYIDRAGGVPAVVARYGADRTFAVPILMNCALAGQVKWQAVAPLPFELACLPHAWFRFVRLHVVSYALPALIAIGQLIHTKRPSRNLLVRWIRGRAIDRSLQKLEAIQPSSGGFLEAVPLTSFVTMSLLANGRAEHPVARRGIEFLARTVRPDGSWPIDSNLSLWVTTLSINALAAGAAGHRLCSTGSATRPLSADDVNTLRDWLLDQQLRDVHPYTNASPGGWGWSHLSGSVPDADDTPGALLALAALTAEEAERSGNRRGRDSAPTGLVAAMRGIRWLLDLQNADGGWPTFCRGWGRLPFDRSGSDLTAHALRAFAAWRPAIQDYFDDAVAPAPGVHPRDLAPRVDRHLPSLVVRATERGLEFLRRHQRPDGSWLPLWFGNQHMPDDVNPTYGTARVLAAYRDLDLRRAPEAVRGVEWLRRAQNPDGGWGGGSGTPSTVEETALAIDALAGFVPVDESLRHAVRRGGDWLVTRVESGDWKKASPIGFYFAKLWYFEELYPQIFTVAALGRLRSVGESG